MAVEIGRDGDAARLRVRLIIAGSRAGRDPLRRLAMAESGRG